jgi:bifunctional ADP-heptose synthase (sugar kinase/adenylyltransferase)
MSLESAISLIDSVKDESVLVLGDTIIDEYHYVTPLGKSPKENLIPVSHQYDEIFNGGVDAAARHLETFVKHVVVASGGPITRKVRMVDATYLRKLFEIHYRDGYKADGISTFDYDTVVVTDFGHGYVTKELIDKLARGAGYLAVNAQTNSANIGFNLITKYKHANYIVIDEPEARLAASDRDSPIMEVLQTLATGRCDKMVITLGTNGAIGYDTKDGFSRYPAITNKVVDTMGAGDAFFAITAPMAKHGHIEDLLLIGNAAGALKTQIVGHRRSILKQELIDYMKAHI